jgi:hypothetical protein
MKGIISTAFLAVAGLLTAGSVSAQDSAFQVTIPFNFAAGNAVLPSGTYTVISMTPEVVLIRNKNHPNLSAMALINQGEPRYAGDDKIVFHRYGDEYFLSKILCPSATMVADLPVTKLENRVRTREASLEQPETVLLAMK